MQPSKYVDDHLPGKNSVSSVQPSRMCYNTDKYWPQFNEPNNHQFKVRSSRGVAKNILEESLLLAAMKKKLD